MAPPPWPELSQPASTEIPDLMDVVLTDAVPTAVPSTVPPQVYNNDPALVAAVSNLQESLKILRRQISELKGKSTERPQPKAKRQKPTPAPTPTPTPPPLLTPARFTTPNRFQSLSTEALDEDDDDFPSLPAASAPTAPSSFATRPKPLIRAKPPTFRPFIDLSVTAVNTTDPAPRKPTSEIPPTVIHDKTSWLSISSHLNSHKISYTRAINTREGIRVLASSNEDLRALHKYLEKSNFSFHSFQLPSEKSIKVVLRGVPQFITNEQVILDLSTKHFIPLAVSRLRGRNNKPAPLVLVQLEKRFSSIYNLKTLCGLDITVEAKKIPSGPLQCHRCQRFGHTQPNCHAPYRCLKCAESHSTHLCPKPPTTDATCANCAEKHISSHHSCRENPVNRAKTYSQATKPSPPPHTNQPQTPYRTTKSITPSDPLAALCYPLFEALLATNPTPQRISEFITQLAVLKKSFLV